ncbi:MULTISPECIES: dTDP-4-dehydrorhamnose reductase [Agrobacterium]|uniref:dTDP-4-dehydrorhamnose reductase n=1 Tax=Agrobacterium TaxID=357 RepID=UPI001E5F7FED|nr:MULTISPECIES: dTDP-4-dehydrorhamnose reductase [Agrobacterium]UHS58222.1 dTDP-4-dehydrorhamnose reductase [Agrobacterium vaccinii]
MKIILLGKNGQVARELRRTLLPFGRIIALGREKLDLEALDRIEPELRAHEPDVIVNAAAYTQVDRAETDHDRAQRLNAEAVGIIADFANRRGATLVHYSTDYVFDGGQETPYLEMDATNPLSVYGQTKREGELAIEASGCRFLLFRTSWIFSAEGTNFVKTILRLAKEQRSLRVVADQFGAPTSAELVADVTALALAAHSRNLLPDGIYHLAAAGRTSWHGLACYIVQRASELGIDLQAARETIEPILTTEYPLPAVRPRNSGLNTDKLQHSLGLSMPDWTVHIDRTLEQLQRREPEC